MVGPLLRCRCARGGGAVWRGGAYRGAAGSPARRARHGSLSPRTARRCSRPSVMPPVLEDLLRWYTGFILVFFFAINSYYLVLTVAGFWRTLQVFREVRRPDQRRLLRSPL